MTLTKEARNYLDRYLSQVKRFLPKGKREDIAAELESYMLDRLEERGREVSISGEDMKAELVKMGAPRNVAATYAPVNTLIAPELFPLFSLITRIVLIVVAVAIPFGVLIGVLTDPAGTRDLWEIVAELVGGVWSGVTSALGTLVIIFYLISRLDHKEISSEQVWNPDDMPELSKDEVPGVWDIAIGTTLTLVFLGFLAYLYTHDGMLPIINTGSDLSLSVSLPGMMPYLPAMALISLLSIVKDSVIMAQGYWSWMTRMFDIVLDVANLVIAGLLLGAMPIMEFVAREGVVPAGFSEAERAVNLGITIALVLALLGQTVEIIKSVIRLIKAETGVPKFDIPEAK